MGAFGELFTTAKGRGWHVLVTHNEGDQRKRIAYDTIDVISGPPHHRQTKLVDREPVVDGRLEPAAARLLERLC